MRGYGQFCPLALAAELFAQRWTPLIIREFLSGSTHFNDLRRGVPRMSRALFARRLKGLVEAGIVERRKVASGGPEYRLTAAGQELAPVIFALGTWGQRWMQRIANEDLSLDFLMWTMHKRIFREKLPSGQTVVRFDFSGVPQGRSRYWMLLAKEDVELCVIDPGKDVDLTVATSVRTMAELWRGLTSFPAALRDKRLVLDGPRELARAFPTWLMLSRFAAIGKGQGAGR